MKTQSAKAKGRRLQQIIASDLLETFPHLSAADIRSTSMGASGEDIQMSALARETIPFSFEAKNQERINIWGSIEQAKKNTPANCHPVVVFKKNNEKPYVAVDWKVFLQLICPKTTKHNSSIQLYEIAAILSNIASEL